MLERNGFAVVQERDQRIIGQKVRKRHIGGLAAVISVRQNVAHFGQRAARQLEQFPCGDPFP